MLLFSPEPSICPFQGPIGRGSAGPWTAVTTRGDGSDQRRHTRTAPPLLNSREFSRARLSTVGSAGGLLRASLGSSAPPRHMTVFCIDAQGTDCRYRRAAGTDARSVSPLLPLTAGAGCIYLGRDLGRNLASRPRPSSCPKGWHLSCECLASTDTVPAQRKARQAGQTGLTGSTGVPDAPAPIIVAPRDRADTPAAGHAPLTEPHFPLHVRALVASCIHTMRTRHELA